MKNYKQYTYLDFIQDDFFVKWASNPNGESNLFWQEWIINHPEKHEDVNLAKLFVQSMRYENKKELKEKDSTRIHENIIRFQNNYKVQAEEKRTQSNRIFWSAAAAILLLITFLGVFKTLNFNNESQVAAEVVTYKTTETKRGTKHTIQLPDGTLVKLNSESSIKYPEEFSSTIREVYLEGEAFFDVVKDADRPFVVKSSGFTTEVVGTSFNIKSYTEESKKVAVVSGLVKVSVTDGNFEFVSPENMVTIDEENYLLLEPFDIHKEIGWKDGLLVFDGNFKDVFEKLERWYGVTITVLDKNILNEYYKGEFNNESLENVLTGIGFTSGFKFEIEKDNILIYN